MPELPEVETVKRGLARLIIGKKIVSQDHNWSKGFPNSEHDVSQFMIGATITDVKRRGKSLVVGLDTDYVLFIHLKMTGQLVFVGQRVKSEAAAKSLKPKTKNSTDGVRFGAGHPNDSLVDSLPDKSTRVTITFEDGSHLYFNDQRKFGWVKLLPKHALQDEAFIKKLGPEPLEPPLSSTMFIQRIRRRNGTTIKAAILDQSVLAGIGNIYADEGLWAARIHPSSRVKDVSDDQLAVLITELKKVLKLSIEKGGSTDKNYVDAEGKRGSYLGFAKVFKRQGHPCERCTTVIEKTRVAGRGTHICPMCQQINV